MKKTICIALFLVMILSSCNKVTDEVSRTVSSDSRLSQSDNSSVQTSEQSENSIIIGSGDTSNSTSANSSEYSEVVSSSAQPSTTSQNTVSTSSAASSGGFDWGNAGGTKLIMLSPSHGSMTDTLKPLFDWSSYSADSYNLILEIKTSGGYQLVEKKTGLSGTEYKPTKDLTAGALYRWRIEAIKDGKTNQNDGTRKDGDLFMAKTDYKNHPANKGMNFTFNGAVSEQVLRNYLSRSVTMSLLSVPSANYENDVRMVFNTGAKYISRATIPWEAETNYDETISRYKEKIDYFHSIDPEIVFEACIFETVFRSCEQVPIPAWVFEAFDQPVVKRNFSYERMLFTSRKYENHWGDGASVPDITKLETQMYFYYRGCRYIDAGFEGIHWGQVMLMGEQDTGHQSYHKLLTMIREYAATHARRKFVFNNAHTHGMLGPDNVLLFDFHAFPMRNRTKPGSVAHAPSEGNPQETILEKNYLDAIYGKSLGGKTYSGWTCSSLPYFVEVDNFSGIMAGQENKPNIDFWPWGMDEISWFVNQPDSYRAQWIDYAYGWLRTNDPVGYFCVTGSRPAYVIDEGRITWYYANSKDYGSGYWGDEEAIRNTWIKYK